jgi:hypothetical protein
MRTKLIVGVGVTVPQSGARRRVQKSGRNVSHFSTDPSSFWRAILLVEKLRDGEHDTDPCRRMTQTTVLAAQTIRSPPYHFPFLPLRHPSLSSIIHVSLDFLPTLCSKPLNSSHTDDLQYPVSIESRTRTSSQTPLIHTSHHPSQIHGRVPAVRGEIRCPRSSSNGRVEMHRGR